MFLSTMFSSIFSSLSQLHFLEPRWLFAFIPLALILWLFSRSRPNVSSWEKVIDHNLLPYLLQGKETKVSKLPKWLLGVGGFIAVIALANPVWEKIARPVFQTNSARVIVLDLSTSMLINDLKPSRLARARFKIEDILSRNEEGQTGLVVFAGDAFTASPLTRDVDTIRNLLQVFTPRLMPAQGSRVDYGLKKAHELLKQAGVRNGQVLLIADGVSKPAIALREAEALKADGHTLSVLAVGTEKGGLLRLRTKRVNIKLDAEALQKISKKGGGGYHIITSNNTDLNTVLKKAVADNNSEQDKNQTKTDDFKSDDWKSSGPYLLLLLLPIAALAFRKGWLLNLFVVFALSIFIAQPEAVYALDNTATNTATNTAENNATNTKTEQSFSNLVSEQWRKLWLNNEQLADRALKQKHYQQASQLSEAPLRKGSASYKSNDYKEALNAFKKGQGADALYNQGNTLAKMEKYKEAIEAYKKALKANPNMKDAQINKKAVEDFLKKKKQQEKKKQQQKNQKDKQKKDDKNKKQQGDKSGDKGKKGKDDAQKKKQGDKQGGKTGDKEGDKKSNEKNQFDKANKDLAKKKDKDNNDNAEKTDKQKQADEEKAAKAKKAEQDKNKAEKAQDESQAKAIKAAKAKAEELSKEEKMAAEQWLRRIPDDPGGLLRRKFRRQYQRNNRRPNDDQQPW